MNAPRRPDGPPVRDGKPYSAIAHLAEDVVPYVAIAVGLRDRNLSAPTILHADLDRGLLIMEDLGDERIVAGDPPAPIEERYEAAVDLLVSLHRRELPETAAGGAAARLSPAALRHRGVPDRGRTAARLVSGQRRRRGDGTDAARRVHRLMAPSAGAGDRGAADLGLARLSFAQSAVAAASARASRASAFSISRTR